MTTNNPDPPKQSSQAMVAHLYWRLVAMSSLEDIREALITGYKTGKPYVAHNYEFLRDDIEPCRILDFGCGIGRNFSPLLRYAWSLTGYDIPEMIDACQRYASNAGVRLSSDWSTLREERFDLTVATLVFQHLPGPALSFFVEEVAKVSPYLYVSTRAWGDSRGHPNVLQVLLDSGYYDYLLGSMDQDSALSINYPDETHIDFVLCSKLCEPRKVKQEHLFKSAWISYESWLKTCDKDSRKLNALEGAIAETDNKVLKAGSSSNLEEILDIYTQKLFDSRQSDIHQHAKNDERISLKSEYHRLAEQIYNTYFSIYAQGAVSLKSDLNTEKVLIIGDYHEPQCVRYRITQKVEQLQAQKKSVTAIDWREVKHNQNLVILHDVVIFYRVPAVPQNLKAMAMVNANGKASFYEIDDLIFEEHYPDTLETYGGYIDLGTHIELRRSMASIYSAARHCRYGIASTKPLGERLQKLVFGGECIIHRNGLDKKSTRRAPKEDEKSTIDIFYGSGTKAHNSDFIELALPALTILLRKYPELRLIVAGYLNLPREFTAEFDSQLVFFPPTRDIEEYFDYLSKADINLSVLKDNLVNGCKSEIKWIEAACFGIPSIVSSTQNFRDILDNGQNALLASSPDEWLVSLETLIGNRSLRSRLAKNAIAKIQSEYSINSLGISLVDHLDRVLDGFKTRQRKKIAIVNVYFPPQAIGGGTRVVTEIFNSMRAHYGEYIDLVVFTTDSQKRAPYHLSAYQHDGVTVYRTTVNFRSNSDWYARDEEMGALFRKFIDLEKPDLVHFHCIQRLTASIVQVTREASIPYFVTVHDGWWISDHQFLVDEQGNVYPDGHPDVSAPRTLPNGISCQESDSRRIFLKEMLRGAKTVLAVSENFANVYRNNGCPDVRVNKNGISTRIQWKPKDTGYTEKVVCAHIGGMVSHKGYFLFKQAVENRQPLNIEILIVDHAKDATYRFNTHWGNVPVTFVGLVAQDEIVDLYGKIDVLYAPSIWPESFGLVTREAASCGCWVVASELGGIGDDVVEGESGFRIKPELAEIEETLMIIDGEVDRFKGASSCGPLRTVDEQVLELVAMYDA